MRDTIQKIKILQYLKNVKTHPTARQVYKEVQKDLPTITLATIYRNLNMMADQGEILRFETGKEYRYDADTSKHQHMVCTGCEKILDMHDEKLEKTILKKEFKNFTPEKVTIIYYGKCKTCRKSK